MGGGEEEGGDGGGGEVVDAGGDEEVVGEWELRRVGRGAACPTEWRGGKGIYITMSDRMLLM